MSRKLLLACIMLTMMTWSVSAFAADKLRYHGSGVMLRSIMYTAAVQFKEKEGVDMDLKGKDTIFGIQKLLNGEADVAGGGRPLTAEEMSKGLVQRKLFLDARVFIVHTNLAVNALSTEQVADILLGKIADWSLINSELASRKIIIISPNQTSAHYKNQKKAIGFDTLPPGTVYCERTPDVYTNVKRSSSNTIGFLSHTNVPNDPDVRRITIMKNGRAVPLDQKNVGGGEYPYVQSMYFYTMGEPKGDTKKFIDFMASAQGKKIITDAGFFLPEQEMSYSSAE